MLLECVWFVPIMLRVAGYMKMINGFYYRIMIVGIDMGLVRHLS